MPLTSYLPILCSSHYNLVEVALLALSLDLIVHGTHIIQFLKAYQVAQFEPQISICKSPYLDCAAKGQ